MTVERVDVLVVGAGLSGIAAGYHLRTKCPDKTLAILEARDAIGGTWDLFRYPGIRSDSDMYTLGYSFRPWRGDKAIADGASILAYIRETAREHGIDRKIRFGHRVISAAWSSDAARWNVVAKKESTGELVHFSAGFLMMCSGYYDYDKGYTPDFPNIDRFRGRVIHPQKWGDDVDYAGKRVVVIGSGATAVTLVPELAKRAAHVTMLQRSPSYILSMPEIDSITRALAKTLPGNAAYDIARWKNVTLSMAMYNFCRRFPDSATKLLLSGVKKQLGEGYDVERHFTPTYRPWDQRLCLVPNGDLFKAIRKGKAEVVTDHIATFTENGIELRSGKTIDADLVVTATGLKLRLLGGVSLEVDGKKIDAGKTLNYKGTMLSDVPNLAIALGYTNASWTLKADLVCAFVCRLLQEMDRDGKRVVVPRRNDPTLHEEPIINFSSGYIQRSVAELPKQGSRAPWKLYQNYFLDLVSLRFGKTVDDEVEMR
jgi:cation diffusion facilitator CzcD-associated flavoprotein CzcO